MVRSGAKLQTVRPLPKRLPLAGDTIRLRAWTGAPYRSPQRDLGTGRLILVAPVEITTLGVVVAGEPVPPHEFAFADGFGLGFPGLRDWFAAVHGLPFSGILLKWVLVD